MNPDEPPEGWTGDAIDPENVSGKFILDGKKVVPCPSLWKWANWFQKANRHVARTTMPFDDDGGTVLISTVFLGLDHGFGAAGRGGQPVLFETMVFVTAGAERREELDLEDRGTFGRYSTWEEAEKGHERIVESVTHGLEEMRTNAERTASLLFGLIALV